MNRYRKNHLFKAAATKRNIKKIIILKLEATFTDRNVNVE